MAISYAIRTSCKATAEELAYRWPQFLALVTLLKVNESAVLIATGPCRLTARVEQTLKPGPWF